MKYLHSIFTQTGRNLKHSWATQLMTLLTVSLSVLIFSLFFLIFLNTQGASARIGDQIRLIVFLSEEVAPALRPEMEHQIREFNPVEKIVFIDRQEALKRLAKQLGPDKDILNDLGSDFLPPAIEVYPKRDLASLPRIKQFSDYLATLPHVSSVQYGQEWLTRFSYFTKFLRIIVILSGGLVILTATFMVASTIRLTVVARQNELEILRLLGASRAYLQLPLFFEGVLQGILGATLGLGTLYLLFQWIKTKFTGAGFLALAEIHFLPAPYAGAILLLSIFLCTLGSLVSIRRLLRL